MVIICIGGEKHWTSVLKNYKINNLMMVATKFAQVSVVGLAVILACQHSPDQEVGLENYSKDRLMDIYSEEDIDYIEFKRIKSRFVYIKNDSDSIIVCKELVSNSFDTTFNCAQIFRFQSMHALLFNGRREKEYWIQSNIDSGFSHAFHSYFIVSLNNPKVDLSLGYHVVEENDSLKMNFKWPEPAIRFYITNVSDSILFSSGDVESGGVIGSYKFHITDVPDSTLILAVCTEALPSIHHVPSWRCNKKIVHLGDWIRINDLLR